jgi:hypothetical protein
MRFAIPPSRVHLVAVLLAVGLLTGCSSGGETAATATTAAPAPSALSTTTVIRVEQRERWARTADQWVTLAMTTSRVTQHEADFMARHSTDLGPTTNAAQMLVFGYDLCEQYASSRKTREVVIQDWAAANPALASLAPDLGADATRLLCPDDTSPP